MKAKVDGHNNRVSGMKSKVEGNDNKVSGMACKVIGNGNKVSGMGCNVQGNNNKVTGSNCTQDNVNISGEEDAETITNVESWSFSSIPGFHFSSRGAVNVSITRQSSHDGGHSSSENISQPEETVNSIIRPSPIENEEASSKGERECVICLERAVNTVILPC